MTSRAMMFLKTILSMLVLSTAALASPAPGKDRAAADKGNTSDAVMVRTVLRIDGEILGMPILGLLDDGPAVAISHQSQPPYRIEARKIQQHLAQSGVSIDTIDLAVYLKDDRLGAASEWRLIGRPQISIGDAGEEAHVRTDLSTEFIESSRPGVYADELSVTVSLDEVEDIAFARRTMKEQCKKEKTVQEREEWVCNKFLR